MDLIEVKSNIIYKENKGKYLFDICYPFDFLRYKKYPTVILISGGSGTSLKLNEKFKNGFLSWGRLLAASGLLTIQFNWNYKNPDDIVDLINFIRSNADKYKVNSNHLSTFSFSRGVGKSFDKIVRENTGYLKSMVFYYGKISPTLSHKKLTLPPIFIVMAGRDKFFNHDCNDKFVSTMKRNGNDIKLVSHLTGEHAFDIRNNDMRSVEIIKQTVEFLKTNTN